MVRTFKGFHFLKELSKKKHLINRKCLFFWYSFNINTTKEYRKKDAIIEFHGFFFYVQSDEKFILTWVIVL